MKLLSQPDSFSLIDEDMKEALRISHMRQSLIFLNDLSGEKETMPPDFPKTTYVVIDFLSKYKEEFQGKEKAIIRALMHKDVVPRCGGPVAHAQLIVELTPLYKRDNYMDYILINSFRGIIARDKLEKNEEEGYAYMEEILNEEGISFSITSHGRTENRPPLDPTFAQNLYRHYRKKYKEELEGLTGQLRSDRDYRKLRQLEDLMKQYEAYFNQALGEVLPALRRYDRMQREVRQSQEHVRSLQRMIAEAQQRRQARPAPRVESKGKRGPVVQEFPKQGAVTYNLAGDYKQKGPAASAAITRDAGSSSSARVVVNTSEVSTSAAVVALQEPLILLNSHHHRDFKKIMDGEEVTRAEFENVLEQLQGSINSRSRGDHTFYNVVRIEDSPRVLSREIGNLLRRTFNLSSGVEAGEEDIDGLLERLGLESRRQGITLSVGAKEKIPGYQLQQVRDHLERAGYTLETVGKG